MYERIFNHDRPSDVALLHHYRYKSADELHWKTCIRGYEAVKGTNVCKSKKYAVGSGADKFNDMAWLQLKRMVPKYQKFDDSLLP